MALIDAASLLTLADDGRAIGNMTSGFLQFWEYLLSFIGQRSVCIHNRLSYMEDGQAFENIHSVFISIYVESGSPRILGNV